jgi:hypothetical protein
MAHEIGVFEGLLRIMKDDDTIMDGQLKMDISRTGTAVSAFGPIPINIGSEGIIKIQWKFDDEWETIKEIPVRHRRPNPE